MKYAVGMEVVMIGIDKSYLNKEDIEYYNKLIGKKGKIIRLTRDDKSGKDCYCVDLPHKYGKDGVFLREEDVKIINNFKYKANDKVVLKNISGCNLSSTEKYYKKYIGRTTKILRITTDDELLPIYKDYVYVLNIKHPTKDKYLYVKEDEIELKTIKPKIQQQHYDIQNLHIIVNEKAVIVIDKDTKLKGVAKCHPDDEFDLKIGFRVALEKLSKKHKMVKVKRGKWNDGVKILKSKKILLW